MLFLVDRHSSLLVGICMECIKERYMPVLLSSISLFGKALFYTQFGMASSGMSRSWSRYLRIKKWFCRGISVFWEPPEEENRRLFHYSLAAFNSPALRRS